jgi:lipid II:glycine glycyltransferase (peptidoglycan interpeptide bridge formation enzyme)
MTRWELITENQAVDCWDEFLTRFDDCSPFQSEAWGEYRRALGWQPRRWIAYDEQNVPVAMMQGYLRRYPLGIGLVWSEGGPVGDLSLCESEFQKVLKETAGLRSVYFRFRCDRPRNIEDSLRLTAQGWSMPWSMLTTNYTMTIDLNVPEESLLASCERNWRRNLKRSRECDLTVGQWLKPDVAEISSVYRSMENLKGLEEQQSAAETEQMLKELKQHLVVYRCEDAKGELLSVMGCLVTGDRACLVISATTARGRELHSSYAIFWGLICHCRNIGVRIFDFAGIDPIRNPGVFRFKRAAGGQPVELLGEWDWASRPWLRWFGNWAIAKRSRIRQAETALKRPTKDATRKPIWQTDSQSETPQRSNLLAEISS